MRIILSSICLMFFFYGAFAQKMEPVKWDAQLVKIDAANYELQLTANTSDKWIVYSQHIDEGGPIPTKFQVEVQPGMELDGDFEDPENGVSEMDEMFSMKLTKFHGPATFTQKISSEKDLRRVTGTVLFMTCDNSKCLPPTEINFVATLK